MATRLLSTQRTVNLSSNPASATAGEIYYNTSDNKLKFYNGTSWTDFGGGSGTVTSVGVSVPTGLSVANSPVTTSGTIAISLASGYTIPTTTALDAKAPLISPTLTTPNIGVATGTSFNSITGLSSTAPVVNGTAAVGTGTTVARADHVHPTDTSRAALSSPTFTGTPASTTAAADTNTTQIATTAFVLGQAGASTPIVNGTAAAGTSLRYSRQDHVHPTTGLGLTSGTLAQFAATTSSQLAGVISDETGSGALVFATSPSLTTPNVGVASGTSLTLTGALTAQTKSFDIAHPTKDNMRLRYGSLEGPENGVYVRGKSNSSTITLPDYWTGLVDEDTITVQLTSSGKKQKLYVKKASNKSVEIGGVRGEYFYFIQAERKDVDKLVVEYGS